jgi:citronellol/citronellal dehydrogenase
MKRFDLMFGVNVRGTYACSQALIPYLEKTVNPHILTLSPPLAMDPKWFRNHCAYTMANALWPRTVIATAAVAMLGGAIALKNCRKPEIVADAAHAILVRDGRSCTGNFFIDEDILSEEGVTDFSPYAYEPGAPLFPDLFLD